MKNYVVKKSCLNKMKLRMKEKIRK